MTEQRPPRRRRSRGSGANNRVPELWRAVPDPDPVPPIKPSVDPAALVRSLDAPPLRGHAAAHYIASVVERAALLATALAASADLLDESTSEH